MWEKQIFWHANFDNVNKRCAFGSWCAVTLMHARTHMRGHALFLSMEIVDTNDLFFL